MKRVICFILCVLFAVSLTACGNDGKISVTFNGNGGMTESGKTSVTLEIDPKGDFVAPIFTREDYRFIGWADENGNRIEFREIEKNVTVYAQWLQVLFTVTLDGNGGETEDGQKSVEVKVDPLKTPEIPEFTYEGYDFVGWDINFAEVTQNCTATAIWAENGTVRTKITFDAVGGTEYTGEDVYFYVGAEIPANVFYTPERGVDRFEGWYYNDEKLREGEVWYAPEGVDRIVLTARWRRLWTDNY